MDKNKIERCVSKMIFNDKTLNVKDFESIYIKLNNIFKNKRFSLNLNNLKVNWLEISNDDVTKTILDYIESFEKVST